MTRPTRFRNQTRNRYYSGEVELVSHVGGVETEVVVVIEWITSAGSIGVIGIAAVSRQRVVDFKEIERRYMSLQRCLESVVGRTATGRKKFKFSVRVQDLPVTLDIKLPSDNRVQRGIGICFDADNWICEVAQQQTA